VPVFIAVLVACCKGGSAPLYQNSQQARKSASARLTQNQSDLHFRGGFVLFLFLLRAETL